MKSFLTIITIHCQTFIMMALSMVLVHSYFEYHLTNLSFYFDGLLQVVNNDKAFKLPATMAKFHKTESNNITSNYEGTLNIYDAFVTKDSMTQNV